MLNVSRKGRLLRSLTAKSWTFYGLVNAVAEIRFNGEPIAVPVLDRMGAALLDFTEAEGRFVSLLQRLLANRPGPVFDVGANTGRFLIYVLAADRARAYVGFEPLPKGWSYVNRLIEANRLATHKILPVALSDRTGLSHLRFNSPTDVFATTTGWFYGPSFFEHSVAVPTFTGDELLPSLTSVPPALLKVDVEGGELEVFRGFADLLTRDKPMVVTEVIPASMRSISRELTDQRRARSEQLDRLFRRHGYACFRIVGGDALEPVAVLDPDAPGSKSDLDYLYVPVDTAAVVASLGRAR
jgi:FkbM family methyltransferase